MEVEVAELERLLLISVVGRLARRATPALAVWGPPGCGKSSIITSFAKSLGGRVEVVELAQQDPTLLGGYPVPTPHGKERTIRLIRPSWWVELEEVTEAWRRGESDTFGLLFLDELTQAHPSITSAVLELVRTASYPVVIAGNRMEEGGLWEPPPPLSNRLLHVVLKPTRTELSEELLREPAPLRETQPRGGLRELVERAKKEVGWRRKVALYVLSEGAPSERDIKPQPFAGWATNRSLEFVAETLSILEVVSDGWDEKVKERLVEVIVDGCIGAEEGVRFLEWMRSKVDLDAVLSGALPLSSLRIDQKYKCILKAIERGDEAVWQLVRLMWGMVKGREKEECRELGVVAARMAIEAGGKIPLDLAKEFLNTELWRWVV